MATEKTVSIETVYRLVGSARVSIGSLQLTHDAYPAVFAWNREKRREIACVLFGQTVSVFEVVDFKPVPLGRFADTFDDIDELAAYIDVSLTTCPRCGGSGEVPYSYSNEAGHWVRETVPCPVCTAAEENEVEELPF